MDPLRDLYHQVIRAAPTIALFVAVLLAGLVVASVARRLTVWTVRSSGIEALAERAGAARFLYAVGIKSGLVNTLARLVWVCGLLITAAAGAEVLGLPAVAAGVAIVMGFVPRLLAAAVVLVAGSALATVVRSVIARVGRRRPDLEHPGVVASLIYYVIIAVTVVMAASQAGLQTALVDAIVVVALTLILGALAVAFVLGSRAVFANLIAGHYVRRLVQPGDRVRVGAHEGVVVRQGAVALILETSDGEETVIPCRFLLDDAFRRRSGDDDAGAARTSP